MTVICPKRCLRSLKINIQQALNAIDAFQRILRKSEFSIHLYMNTFMYVSGVPTGGGVGWGVQRLPPPEIPKALQNRAKLNPIMKTVKKC